MDRLYHQPAHAILLCQCVTAVGGTGISTSCPSPTTPVLGLGPDLPWADEPSPGNLGLSTCRFLACISLLIPAFSLLHRPRRLSIPLLPMHYAPLPLTAIYTILVPFHSPASPRWLRLRRPPRLRWCLLLLGHLANSSDLDGRFATMSRSEFAGCPGILQVFCKWKRTRSFGGVF